MSVSRCMREVDSAEFAEWMAFATWEPFGPEREDQRAGMIAALIANVNRDSSKRPQPYDVDDFFPRYDQEQYEEAARAGTTGEAAVPDLEAKIFAWAARMNAANDSKPAKSELRPKGPKG